MVRTTWEAQFESMIKAGHIDAEAINDFGVAYMTETGDPSFIGAGAITFLLTPYTEWAPYGPVSYSRSNSSDISTAYTASTSEAFSVPAGRSWSVGGRTMSCSVSSSNTKEDLCGSVMEARIAYGEFRELRELA